jgi:hypothetical protein
MKKKAFLFSLFMLIPITTTFAELPVDQITKLNTSKRLLKSNVSELLDCMNNNHSCSSDANKTTKNIVDMARILTTPQQLLPIPHMNKSLKPYRLFVQKKGYHEPFKELQEALQYDDIDKVKKAIQQGALYYPDSKYTLFDAKSTDAVYYLLANYPGNLKEILNAQKSFPVGIGGTLLILSPLAYHKFQGTSGDIENILLKFNAQDINQPSSK